MITFLVQVNIIIKNPPARKCESGDEKDPDRSYSNNS